MSLANKLDEPASTPIAPPADMPDDGPPIPPAVAKCLAAYARDLPTLLVTHPRKWVAYVDGEQLRIADTQTELYRQCLYELNLPHEQFIVRYILEDAGGTVEYTLR